MLYLDSSATLKLLREEAESAALADFLAAADEALMTSRVGVVELRRVARRGGASQDRADALAGTLEILELDARVEGIAVKLAPDLRALDAIHLASALAVRGEQMHAFVCYDHRLSAAAAREGLPIVAPWPGRLIAYSSISAQATQWQLAEPPSVNEPTAARKRHS